MVCAANQVAVPCRLPHDARCEPAFPALAARTGYAHGEVNLLNELDDMKHRRFASFENALVALGDTAYEYQCVWNADGIFDNRASPAGSSNVIWRPGRSSDEAYRRRGTQVCRAWDVEPGVELPLLSLQNTIRASGAQEMTERSKVWLLAQSQQPTYARLHAAQATVAVTLPSDRRLHEAMWLQTLLVSFAVADVSQSALGPAPASPSALP